MKTFSTPSHRSPAAVPVRSTSSQAAAPQARQILHAPRPQAKLTVGAPDDAFEREADEVAGEVMRMTEGITGPGVQRMCQECEDELQARFLGDRSEPEETPSVPEGFESRFSALQGGGRPLPASERAFFEPRFGRDFSEVRLHSGPAAGELARSVHARAFTLGNSIVLGSGESGRELLAHELTHVIQQTPRVQRQADPRRDPARFDTLHQNLFVNAPAAGGGARKAWGTGTGTAAQIKDAFKKSTLKQIKDNPLSLIGTMSVATTQQQAETAAVAADADLHTTFPQIPTQLGQAQLRQHVVVFAPDFEPQSAPSPDFLANWVDNQLPNRTTIEQFTLDPADPVYRQIVSDLAQDSGTFPLADILAGVRAEAKRRSFTQDETDVTVENVRSELAGKSWSWLFNRLASRTGAFHGQGLVFISQSLPAARRRPTLLHELIHAYADSEYRRWVESTTNERLFNEGFTEILTREALTPPELAARTSYQGAVDVINTQVMPFISVDDLARAFFRGEVWRIEGNSQISQEMFERQAGIAAGATRAEETAQSRGGAGIVQTVEAGSFYRLLNFGNDSSAPKPEHETFLRDVILPIVQGDSTVRLRFVGHADETGPASHNQTLSRARAKAVYALAEKLGIPRSQLLDVAAPAGSGEREPTAGNTTVHGRAMNRRVEIFLTHQP